MKKCIRCSALVKCQLCENMIPFQNTIVIKNKVNGNVLRICKGCGREFNWIKD